jgi:PII-like signaling protein
VKTQREAKRVTVYVGETDRTDGHPLYQAIIAMLHAEKIAGATATRGIMGFGQSAHVHAAHLLDVADDLPVAVVFVDTAENVERVLPKLDELVSSGLVVIEDVRAITYRSG